MVKVYVACRNHAGVAYLSGGTPANVQAHTRELRYTHFVDSAYKLRAEERRRRLRGGVAKSFEDLEEAGLVFWATATADERLRAIFEMHIDAWIVGGKLGPAPRFDGSTWGIGRFER